MDVPLSLTLADVLERQARERPHAPALRFEDGQWSYAGLAQSVQDAAAVLWHGAGVRRGDRVAWLGANHPGQLVLLFALARIGAVLVPLNFRLAAAEWDAVLADCSPTCVVHDASWQQAAGALAARAGIPARSVDALGGRLAGTLPGIQGGMQAGMQAGEHELAPEEGGIAGDPALLVYTSGTTGRPKGAVHTQANLLANMAAACAAQEMSPADVVATVLPMFHVGGLCIQTLPALFAGASVILHPRFDPEATLACFAQDRPSLTLLVPAVMKALLEHSGWAQADLSGLRAVWAGSSTLPQSLVEAFHARGVPVCNVYGATETGPFSVALTARHAFSHPGSCGWPAQGVEVRLEQPGADGAGEILLRGPNVAQRYWPDVPAVDAGGWFHSGDLARQAADGSYTIVGRLKDMIISGGENIYPAEIENLLMEHPAVAECAVVGLPDEKWGEVAVAAIVARAGMEASANDILAFLGERIARYKLPRRVVWLDALPKTALGKVQKVALQGRISGPQAAGVLP